MQPTFPVYLARPNSMIYSQELQDAAVWTLRLKCTFSPTKRTHLRCGATLRIRCMIADFTAEIVDCVTSLPWPLCAVLVNYCSTAKCTRHAMYIEQQAAF